MADFDAAFNYVLGSEGGPDSSAILDPITSAPKKFGVTLPLLNAIRAPGSNRPQAANVEALTLEQAKEIYKVHFWSPSPSSLDSTKDQRIANAILDLRVMLGLAPAAALVAQVVKQMYADDADVEYMIGLHADDFLRELVAAAKLRCTRLAAIRGRESMLDVWMERLDRTLISKNL